MGYVILVIVVLLIVAVVLNIKIVPQSDAYVVERLGAYHSTWKVGLNFMIPYIDRIAGKMSLKERVEDFLPQPVITADNITMKIDTVVYYQITDPKLYTYGVDNPISAMENLTSTTLRNIIGDLELDATLTSRDLINTKMRAILDEATDSWGIRVNRVEVKNIEPPKEIQEAMEKQMRAERGKREEILVAEGQQLAMVLRAQGEKDSQILIAEGQKISQILKSEAVKEQKRLVAEGEAAAILNTQRAIAHGYTMIKAAGVDKNVIALRSLEALEKVADGRATKIIVPSDLQDIAGLVAGISEINDTAIEGQGDLIDDN